MLQRETCVFVRKYRENIGELGLNRELIMIVQKMSDGVK